jgi:type II secretory pathway component PulF
MPEFAYIARDLTGNRVEGTLAAGTEREVIASLSARELFPLKVAAADGRAATAKSPRVRARVMATTYGQLSALLKSGVPLLRSLEVLRQQTQNKSLKIVLEDVHSRVQEGDTLADAMARHPRAFGELAVSIVRAGGEGGFLEEALDRLARFTEQQDELKGRVMGALAYPMILFLVGTLVVNGLVIFFVPKFETLFGRLRAKGELPALTDWLLWVSHTLQDYGIFILAGVIIAGVLIRNRLVTEEGRVWLDKWRLKIPVVSSIYLSLAVSRFCRVLGTLLTNGVPIVRSLEISADSTGNRVLAQAIRLSAENVSSGETLAKPLAECGLIARPVMAMISVAEESNNLDNVLVNIADGIDRQTSRQLDLMVRLLEPLTLLVMASAILFVLIALLLPVFQMSSTIS